MQAGRDMPLQQMERGMFITIRSWANIPRKLTDAYVHDLRAKSLTDAKRQGLNLQTLAGHTKSALTESYIRLRKIPQVEGHEFGKY